MTGRDFAYFMQSLFEVANMKSCNEEQWEIIRRHLALVFAHEIDPSQGPPEHQAKLNEIHSPSVAVTPESMKEAIDAAVSKLPKKKQIGGHGPGGTMYRC